MKTLKSEILRTKATEDLVKMATFLLNNNIFKFNSSAYQQKSGRAIRTKFAPPYA